MSRATGGARPWNESAGRVGQRHLPRPPTSALIDAPRQSNFRLRASFFVAIITTATTPDSHPDCRALLVQIVALHTDGPNEDMARNHKAGGQGEPHAARMGELLPSRHRQQGVSGTRQLHSDAVAPVVAVQAQNQASQGRDLSTLASVRALWARTPEQAWARRAVGEGVKFCPRAGCGVR